MNKARSFVSLSDKVNSLGNRYSDIRSVLDELIIILEARAGLVWLAGENGILYSKHLRHSNLLVSFERALHDKLEETVTLLRSKRNARVHRENGLLVSTLTWQQRIVGAIALDRDGKILTPHEEMGLVTLSNQLAAILALRESQPACEGTVGLRKADIDDAVAVQQSLQPSIPPSLVSGLAIATHTQAAEFIGGDYFDLILLDKNRMGIVIADVQGKGVSAALFGNLLRSTVHFLTRETPSTGVLMGKINTILHKEANSFQRLFTMFYAVYDSENKALSYSGSGHTNPIVVRASEKVERLLSEGMLMGVEPTQRFGERTIQLAPGDIVVFFTDGLSDCVNAAGEMFGEERLVEVLRQHRNDSVDEIVNGVMCEVSRFAQSALSDDLTLVVTKVL